MLFLFKCYLPNILCNYISVVGVKCAVKTIWIANGYSFTPTVVINCGFRFFMIRSLFLDKYPILICVVCLLRL